MTRRKECPNPTGRTEGSCNLEFCPEGGANDKATELLKIRILTPLLSEWLCPFDH